MRTYKEEQRFSQWWLYAIIIAVMGGLFVEIHTITSGFSGMNNNWPSLFFYLFVVLLLFGILNMKLKTKIDETGIKAQFKPFTFINRKYSWNEIEECYVRKYYPISEYGGWGIRGFGTATAYNISGNMGIQIITKNKQRFLIGTRQPENVEKVLDKYKDKVN